MSNERSYSPGWCTWWVAKSLPWVPAGLGNADTWPERAKAKKLTLTLTPTKGAVVCYAPGHGYSSLGHVAVVTAVYHRGTFEVSEMAYIAWNKVDLRTSNSQDVAAFILAPGMVPTPAGQIKPAPLPKGVDGARLAWTDFAHLFTQVIPRAVGELSKVAADSDRAF